MFCDCSQIIVVSEVVVAVVDIVVVVVVEVFYQLSCLSGNDHERKPRFLHIIHLLMPGTYFHQKG